MHTNVGTLKYDVDEKCDTTGVSFLENHQNPNKHKTLDPKRYPWTAVPLKIKYWREIMRPESTSSRA